MVFFPKYILKKNKRLYLYDKYKSWLAALKVAKYYQKKLRNSYYIVKSETFFYGDIVYGLYMTKVVRFF